MSSAIINCLALKEDLHSVHHSDLILDKMCVRYLGFVLLVWFPAAVHATQHCNAPDLDGGYFVPFQQRYPHKTNLSYSCDNGLKPAVEGWWATSTCENGEWSPTPQCIDEKYCFPPNIPNAKYTEAPKAWYEEQKTIRIICDKGYELKNHDVTAQCINGTWTSVPICEKSTIACGDPPQLPHAVIINQKYQEVFAVHSRVQYECEDGYATEREGNKTIICLSGSWTNGPVCKRTLSVGHSGSAVGGTGPSTSSGASEREVGLQMVTIRNCGKPPSVQNGDVVETRQMFLRYRCNSFYSLVGQQTVVCYSNGMWSEAPTCKATYCTLNTEEYPVLKFVGVKYIKNGETASFECVKKSWWLTDHYAAVQCIDREPKLGK